MTLYYTFVKNRKDYDYEFDVDRYDVLHIVKPYIVADGYNWEEVDDETIDEYIENCMDEIKEYFYEEAKEQWEDEKAYNDDPLGYYSFSYKDFI